MAAVRFTASVSGAAITTPTTMTVISILAAANQCVEVHGFEITLNGIDSTKAPEIVQVLTQTSAGTSSALTLVKRNSSDPETLTTLAYKTFTVEPTGTTLIKWQGYVSPLGGRAQYFPFHEPILVRGGEYLGIRIVTPTASTSAAAVLHCEE